MSLKKEECEDLNKAIKNVEQLKEKYCGKSGTPALKKNCEKPYNDAITEKERKKMLGNCPK